MLAPTRVFSGQSNFAQTTPVAMVMKNWEFYQKICHNFGRISDRVAIFGSMVWFSWSAISTMPVTFGSDIPLLPWQRKFAIFNTKLYTTQMLAPTRGFSESANLIVSVSQSVKNFVQTTPVAIVTKNWEFYPKICHNFDCICI